MDKFTSFPIGEYSITSFFFGAMRKKDSFQDITKKVCFPTLSDSSPFHPSVKLKIFGVQSEKITPGNRRKKSSQG